MLLWMMIGCGATEEVVLLEEEPGRLTGDVEADLTRMKGCGTVGMYAFPDEDDVLLTAIQRGMIEALYDLEASSIHRVITLPDDTTKVTIETGKKLGAYHCNDVVTDTVFDEGIFVAEEGTLELLAVPVEVSDPLPLETPARASLILTDVRFVHDTDGREVYLERIVWTETVGVSIP